MLRKRFKKKKKSKQTSKQTKKKKELDAKRTQKTKKGSDSNFNAFSNRLAVHIGIIWFYSYGYTGFEIWIPFPIYCIRLIIKKTLISSHKFTLKKKKKKIYMCTTDHGQKTITRRCILPLFLIENCSQTLVNLYSIHTSIILRVMSTIFINIYILKRKTYNVYNHVLIWSTWE